MIDPRRNVQLSLVNSARDTNPRATTLTLDAMPSLGVPYFERVEKDGPGFVLALFDGKGREDENVVACTGIGLDRDKTNCTPERVARALGVMVYGYTTSGHGSARKNHKPCWRDVIFTTRHLTPEEQWVLIREVYRLAVAAGVEGIDTSCFNVARLFFLDRAKEPGATFDPVRGQYYGEDLPMLDPDALPWGGSVGELLDAKRAEEQARAERAEALKAARQISGRGEWAAPPNVQRRVERAKAKALRLIASANERRPGLYAGARRIGKAIKPLLPDSPRDAAEALGASFERVHALTPGSTLDHVLADAIDALLEAVLERSNKGDLDGQDEDLKRQIANGIIRDAVERGEGSARIKVSNPWGQGSARLVRRSERAPKRRKHSKARKRGRGASDVAQASGDAPTNILPSMRLATATGVLICTGYDEKGCATFEPEPEPEPEPQNDDQEHTQTLVDMVRDYDETATIADVLGDGAAATLIDGRAELGRLVLHTLRDDGVHVIKAPAGAGKSYAVRCAIVERLFTLPDDARVIVVVPSRDLAEEVADDYRREIQSRRAELLAARAGEVVRKISALIGGGDFEHVRDAQSAAEHLVAKPRDPRVAVAVTRTPETCEHYKAVIEAARIAPGGSSLYCKRCPLHPNNGGACGFFDEQSKARGADVTIMTHALFSGLDPERLANDTRDDSYLDAVVIDESIWPSLKVEGAWTAGALAHQQDLGELALHQGAGLVGYDGALRSPLDVLRAMITRSLETPRQRIGWRQIAAVVPASHVEVKAEYVEADILMGEACDLDDVEARAQHMANGTPWEGLAGLAACLERGWRGAYIQAGLLVVATSREVPDLDQRVTLALDATTTPELARAIYGRGAEFHEICVAAPAGLEVIHVPWGAGSSSHADGEDGPESLRAGAIVAGAWRRWATQGSLCVSHMRWIGEQASGWLRDLRTTLEADGGVDFVYFGHPLARGSNAYQEHHTVILHSWHVPRAVTERDAELLAMRLNIDTCDEVERVRWQTQATYLLEGAEMEQTLARIRPLDASPSCPKRIVIMDKRPPSGLGLAVTETVAPDVLAASVTGYLAPLRVEDGGDGDDRWMTHEVMGCVVKAVLDAHGGVYAPGCDLASASPMSQAEAVAACAGPVGDSLWTPFLRSLRNKSYAALRNPVSTRINTWRDHHFQGSWTKLADALGVHVTPVTVGKGGRPWAVLHSEETVDRAKLESWLEERAVQRYRLPGEQAWTYLHGQVSDLDCLLQGMRGFDSVEADTPALELYDWLADAAGVCQRTIRRWVKTIKREGETSVEAILRRWHDVNARERAQAIEGAMRGLWGDHMTRAEASAAYEAKAPGCPVLRDLPGIAARFVDDDDGADVGPSVSLRA